MGMLNRLIGLSKPKVLARNFGTGGYVKGQPYIVTSKSQLNRDDSDAEVTVLDNGVRVVSDFVKGHFAAVGVYVDSGSRFEPEEYSGVSHMLDRIAFKSTENMSSELIQSEVESMGGNVMSYASREIIQYQATVYHNDVERVTKLFSEITQRPLILDQELEECKQATLYEIQDINNNPDVFLPERLHSIAYKNNTLGKKYLNTEDSLHSMSSDMIKNYLNKMYIPNRMVVAASGLDHEYVVDLANRHFGNIKSKHNQVELPKVENDSLLNKLFSRNSLPSFLPDLSKSNYTGGLELDANKESEFTQILVGLEGVKLTDEDLFPLATLQALLGGGSSFSAGGPGKGMHSKLYRTVLNQYGWAQSCQSFNHSYRDTGLFGISGSAPSDFALDMLHVIGYSLSSCTDPSRLSELEVSRAKNHLKNNLLMNLESRLVRLEDMGQQVLTAGYRVKPKEVCDKIDRLQPSDLANVARKLFMNQSTQPTVLAYGNGLDQLKDAHNVLAKFGIGKQI